MKKRLTILLTIAVLMLSGCGKVDAFTRAVCKKYTDGGINTVELKTDGTYVSVTNGKTYTGTWDTDGRSVNVRDGSEEYDGTPISLEYQDENGTTVRFDAVAYRDGNGARRIQLGGVIYVSE